MKKCPEIFGYFGAYFYLCTQGPRCGGHRPAGRTAGRDRRRHHPSQAGHDLHRERDQAVLYGSAPVQAPPEDHLCRHPPQSHRQDRKAQAAGEILRRTPGGGAEPGLSPLHALLFQRRGRISSAPFFCIPGLAANGQSVSPVSF